MYPFVLLLGELAVRQKAFLWRIKKEGALSGTPSCFS